MTEPADEPVRPDSIARPAQCASGGVADRNGEYPLLGQQDCQPVGVVRQQPTSNDQEQDQYGKH
jgi:hypothetical protein